MILNSRHDYGLDLVLLSIDEGIAGYRDDSLDAVKRNREEYGLELKVSRSLKKFSSLHVRY